MGRFAHAHVGQETMTTRWRQLIKRFHPEGIPWPSSVVYSAASKSEVFRRHYELVAQDIAHYGLAGRILDIGTGPGHLLVALRKILPNTVLVGVDISPAMVVQAAKNIKASGYESSIEVRVSGANDLPFADGSFDSVVSTGSLHHWKDSIHALSEVYRVIRTGGYALMYDLVREMPKAIGEEVRRQFGGFRFALLWLHSFEEPFLSPEEMEALGRQSDFAVEGTRFTGALCCLVMKKPAMPAAGEDAGKRQW